MKVLNNQTKIFGVFYSRSISIPNMQNQNLIVHLMHSLLRLSLPINYFLWWKIKSWTTGKDTGRYICAYRLHVIKMTNKNHGKLFLFGKREPSYPVIKFCRIHTWCIFFQGELWNSDSKEYSEILSTTIFFACNGWSGSRKLDFCGAWQ